jgi:hypothetical protein
MKNHKNIKKMSPQEQALLIDHLDSKLQGQSVPDAVRLIREFPEAFTEFEHLQFSVELIREYGVQEQVAAAKRAFRSTAMRKPIYRQSSGAVVRSLYKTVLRAAAIVLLLVGSAAVYEYATTNSASVFEKGFVSYDLSTSRGNDVDADIEKAYRNKDWSSVINIFDSKKENNTKNWFLGAMAEMQLKKYDRAILSLNEVMLQNKTNPVAYFQDEAEYYLALSYIAAKKPVEGVAILKKIIGDKNHLFNERASEISGIDLEVLELKGDR